MIKHGFSNEPLYYVWIGIKNRCFNKKNKDYKYYGAKGIKMCKEWEDDYIFFKNWLLKNNYKKGLQLDRINNKGNYEPNNCRVVDSKHNNNNRGNNIYITHNNITKTLTEWSEYTKINYHILYRRLKVLKLTPENGLFNKKQ